MAYQSGKSNLTDWDILIVEDDPYHQQLLKLVFNHNDIRAEVVGSAEEAWELLSTGKHFTAAILDLMLPGMDGWTLHQRMQSSPVIKDIPCVVMTASHSERISKRAKEEGFVAFFPKPIMVRELVNDLRRVLA